MARSTASTAGDRPEAAPARTRSGKRERLIAATTDVLHRQGVEKTTIADIAQAADVPVGNVYYYFKTKDQLVRAAIGEHRSRLGALTATLDREPHPAARLKALIAGWVDQRDVAARYGCPFGTLASELDKRDDGLDREAADVMRELVDWAAVQFGALGREDAHDAAVALVAGYQGMSLLANTFRDPEIMTVQGARLTAWIDEIAAEGT